MLRKLVMVHHLSWVLWLALISIAKGRPLFRPLVVGMLVVAADLGRTLGEAWDSYQNVLHQGVNYSKLVGFDN